LIISSIFFTFVGIAFGISGLTSTFGSSTFSGFTSSIFGSSLRASSGLMIFGLISSLISSFGFGGFGFGGLKVIFCLKAIPAKTTASKIITAM
jgi:hypothetical protein